MLSPTPSRRLALHRCQLASGQVQRTRQPLKALRMPVPLLREINPNKESLSLLATMETSAQRGANIIKQLLSFGRGASGIAPRVAQRAAAELEHRVVAEDR